MNVTLAKALIIKNRIVQELSQITARITKVNIVVMQGKLGDDIKPAFRADINILLKERGVLVDKLIAVKVAISVANKEPTQQGRIFALGELKALITMLNSFPVEPSRTIGDRYGSGDTSIVTQSFVQIDEEQRDKAVKEIQKTIDTLQEEMEKFNWKTEIEIPD
jgi:hypothetical protein